MCVIYPFIDQIAAREASAKCACRLPLGPADKCRHRGCDCLCHRYNPTESLPADWRVDCIILEMWAIGYRRQILVLTREKMFREGYTVGQVQMALLNQ